MSIRGKAISALIPDANFTLSNDKIFHWDSKKEMPSEEDIKAKEKELIEADKKLQYQRDRKYPDLGEQFDLLFKDIDSGKVSKDGGFYKAIKSVKDAHPKPSE